MPGAGALGPASQAATTWTTPRLARCGQLRWSPDSVESLDAATVRPRIEHMFERLWRARIWVPRWPGSTSAPPTARRWSRHWRPPSGRCPGCRRCRRSWWPRWWRREPAVSASFAGDAIRCGRPRGRHRVHLVGAGRGVPRRRLPGDRRAPGGAGGAARGAAGLGAGRGGRLVGRGPGGRGRGWRGRPTRWRRWRWSGLRGRPRRSSGRGWPGWCQAADPAGADARHAQARGEPPACRCCPPRTGWPSCGRCSPRRTPSACTPRWGRPAGRPAAPSATPGGRQRCGRPSAGSRPWTRGRCRPWTSAAPTPSSRSLCGTGATGGGPRRGWGGFSPRRGAPPGAPTGTGPVPRGQRPQILVTVPAGTLLGLGGEPAHLAGYGPIPDALARELAQDGVWRRVLTDPATGAVLDVGRSQHDPPADLDRFVRVRDGMCRFPGCRRQAAGCDLDHTVPYPDGRDVRGEPARPVPPPSPPQARDRLAGHRPTGQPAGVDQPPRSRLHHRPARPRRRVVDPARALG